MKNQKIRLSADRLFSFSEISWKDRYIKLPEAMAMAMDWVKMAELEVNEAVSAMPSTMPSGVMKEYITITAMDFVVDTFSLTKLDPTDMASINL